jgi:hypothetical protein
MTEIVAFEGERIRAEIKRLLEEKNSLMSHQRTLVAAHICHSASPPISAPLRFHRLTPRKRLGLRQPSRLFRRRSFEMAQRQVSTAKARVGNK